MSGTLFSKDLSSGFECTIGELVALYDDGNGDTKYLSIVTDGTAHSGDNYLLFQGGHTPGTEPMLVYWYPHYYQIQHYSFWLRMPSLIDPDPNGNWNWYDIFYDYQSGIGLEYDADVDELWIYDADYNMLWGATDSARPTDWKHFEFIFDYSECDLTIKIDGIVVFDGDIGGLTYQPYWETEWWFGGNYVRNVLFHIDDFTVTYSPSATGSYSYADTFQEVAEYPHKFAYAVRYGKNPAGLTTEGVNSFVRFANTRVLDKGFQILESNDISFDFRMPSAGPPGLDGEMFILAIKADNAAPNPPNHYDWWALSIMYESTGDTFYLGPTDFTAAPSYSWARTSNWQNIRIVWTWDTDNIKLYLDDVLVADYTLIYAGTGETDQYYLWWGDWNTPTTTTPQIDLDNLNVNVAYVWPNPYYVDGWDRELLEIGSTSHRLDGSQHQQSLAHQWQWHLIWRRGGAVYQDLMAHILAMCGAETSWTDHLGNTETVNVASLEDLLLTDGATHEVTAVFREVTA